MFDLHRKGTYSDADFAEQKTRINQEIERKNILLEENRIEEFNMDEALTYCFDFLRDGAKTWKEFEEEQESRLRFQKRVFPENLTFDGEKLGTTKTSLIYELNQPENADSTNLVHRIRGQFELRVVTNGNG